MNLKLKQSIAYVVAGVSVVGVAVTLAFTVGGVGGGKSGPEPLTADLAGTLMVPAFAKSTGGGIYITQVLACEKNPQKPQSREFGCIAIVAGQGVDQANSCGGFVFAVGPDPLRKITLKSANPVDQSYCYEQAPVQPPA